MNIENRDQIILFRHINLSRGADEILGLSTKGYVEIDLKAGYDKNIILIGIPFKIQNG
ncbi:MAG: hypothetical protein MK086_06880 [Flavobacteriales bacterium]|nr:hypothetical protein [Flavobacteriales bacterium]